MLDRNLKALYFSYEGILAVYMIGLLKLEKYIPVLAELLDRDEDILLVETAASLIQFQSDEVIRAITPYLMKPESVIFARSVAENIKTDLAVQVLREAYHVAKTIDNQDLIIDALCHHLSNEALPEIRDHMEKGKFSTVVDIEETVYSFFKIIGEDHPKLEKEKRYREIERNGSLRPLMKKEKKVGWNDPCPCGSGKKYKKCCGK